MELVNLVDAGGARMQLIDVDGSRTCTFDRELAQQVELIRGIKDFECKEDDVFILAPVKSGTHWLWEIVSMLQNGHAETIPKRKAAHMLENETADQFDAIASPRVLNSHLHINNLPRQLFEKKCKIVHILRNPKDMLVSWFHHVTGILCYGYDGKWEDFFQLFVNNELEYGSWFDYVKEWERFITDNTSHPALVVFYEDLQKNNVHEIKRVAEFLDTNADDDLITSISQKCHFQNMHKDKVYPEGLRKTVFKGEFTMYRKGVVGDWKNWFTVAQSEQFDVLFSSSMADSNRRFMYS